MHAAFPSRIGAEAAQPSIETSVYAQKVGTTQHPLRIAFWFTIRQARKRSRTC